jgi:AcrR family transcriptional regulator
MSPRPRSTSDAAILSAAHRAVTRVGPMRLTLADVAREAGVSPATLVKRFGSKRQLLLALVAAGSGETADEWARILALARRSPLEALYAYAECMAGMAPTPDVLANHLSFLQMDLIDPEFHRHALAHARGTLAFLSGCLEEAVVRNELTPCDTTRLARAVQATVGGSLMQWAIDRKGRLRRRLREDLETLLSPRYPAGRQRRDARGRPPRTTGLTEGGTTG